MAATVKTPTSLVAFARAKKLKDCSVCKLPVEVRGQLATATDKKISRRDVLEWLKTEIKAAVSDAELTTHRNGKHDA